MKEYVNIPNIVRAIKFDLTKHFNDKTLYPMVKTKYGTRVTGGTTTYIETITGKANIVNGDYIIQENDGVNYYPCPTAVFDKKYKLK